MASVPLQTLEAVTSFLNSDPRAKTLIGLAQNLAGGEGVSFVDAIKAHDWSTVATDVLTEGLTAAAAFGVPGASIALKMIPVVIWAAKHPASVESAAMQKVTGDDGRPGANIAGGA